MVILKLRHQIVKYIYHIVGVAGRENSEERRNGEVCNSACYYVFRDAASLDTQGDNYVINVWRP